MEKIKADKVVPMNIIFPLRGSRVLLGIKTRKIGVGLFNGFGGKQEFGQTMLQSCVTELTPESGLTAEENDFTQIGRVNFFIHKDDGRIVLNQCDIFTVENFSGEPIETEEMIKPTWFEINNLPTKKMMIDASFWMERMLKGDKIEIDIHLNEKRTHIIGSMHSRKFQD